MIKSINELDGFFNSYNPSLGSGKLRENRLDRMRILLSELGNPELSYKTIHIAGSKGKGTTAIYLSKIIKENGFKCGLYMSPHVYDLRERFSLAGEFFSLDDYLKAANELEEVVSKLVFDESLGLDKPTTFELYTAYAFLLFKNTGCDYAVIETGMGGRLDATNVINPIASVFTAIELEHTNVLGETLKEIATEKSGIIKDKTPVFVTSYDDEIMDVIQEKADIKKAPIYKFSKEATVYSNFKYNEKNDSIDTIISVNGQDYSLSMDSISSIKGFDSMYAFFITAMLGINKKASIDLSDVTMPARYEEKPLAINQDKIIRFIYDGAHTPLSVFMTMDTIIRHFKIKQDESGHEVLRGEACLILSFADGKKIEEMLHILVPYFQNVIITGCGSFKKSNPEEIYKLAKEVSPSHDISMIEDPVKAVTRAIRRVDKFGTVFVIGSFYLCAEIKNALKELGYES